MCDANGVAGSDRLYFGGCEFNAAINATILFISEERQSPPNQMGIETTPAHSNANALFRLT